MKTKTLPVVIAMAISALLLSSCENIALKKGVSAQVAAYTAPAPTSDPNAPTIVQSTPTDLATVGLGVTSITIKFNSVVTGAMSASSYQLSGAGKGSATISGVSNPGSNTYQLTLSGALTGGAVKVSCPGVKGSTGVAATDTVNFTVDNVPPTYTVSSTVSNAHGFTGAVVTFNEAVSAAALTSTNYTVTGASKGTLAVASVAAHGSTPNAYDLTFSGTPSSTDSTVVVTASSSIADAYLNALAQAGVSVPFDLSWYVSPSGSDAAAGTKAAPLATITAALTQVKATNPTAPTDIRIRSGTYSISTSSNYLLDMGTSGNINLKGGYDAGFSTTTSGTTVVQGNSTGAFYTVVTLRACGIVDGLTVNFSDSNSGQGVAVGILLADGGHAIVRNCLVLGSTTNSNTVSHYAIASNSINGYDPLGISAVGHSDLSGVKIYNNVIRAGGTSTTLKSYAVYLQGGGVGAAPVIDNNLLDGGAASSETYGLFNNYSGTVVEDNLFYSGSPTATNAGIRMSNSTGDTEYQLAVLRNNAFQLHTSANLLVRIGLGYTGSTWSSATNYSAEQFAASGYASAKTPAALGNLDLTGAATPLVFVDSANNNWRLSASSPAGVRKIALVDTTPTADPLATPFFTTDADGVTRTVPWSMGPYEQDAP